MLTSASGALTLRREHYLYRQRVARPYDDVRLDLEFAITEHNFRITGGNTIGAAIAQRHGEDFPRSEILHFCNLEHARRLLQRAPDFLSYLPCVIFLREAGAEVVVETWLLPEDDPRIGQAGRNINAILRDIVDYATIEWPGDSPDPP
ncbi:MAG: DUF302 domain-containing protein [Candidatus Competibacterales bacterium]|nr:DUF302 domain-containing protein [Candidatus Competibacterales bacterium]